MPICAIVGAGPRIGNGLAQSFAQIGHDIVLISRNTATTEEIAADVRKKGIQAHQIAFDATDRAPLLKGSPESSWKLVCLTSSSTILRTWSWPPTAR